MDFLSYQNTLVFFPPHMYLLLLLMALSPPSSTPLTSVIEIFMSTIIGTLLKNSSSGKSLGTYGLGRGRSRDQTLGGKILADKKYLERKNNPYVQSRTTTNQSPTNTQLRTNPNPISWNHKPLTFRTINSCTGSPAADAIFLLLHQICSR